MAARDRAIDRPQRAGWILIAIGLALFAHQLFDLNDAVLLGAIAAVFLAALVATREYGFLIPTMIFSGLSAGTAAVLLGEDSGGAVVLGLGGAFLATYVIGTLAFGRPHWWPLIPGGILTAVGSSLVFGGPQGAELAGRIWPLVIIGIGALMLLGARGTRRSQASPPTP